MLSFKLTAREKGQSSRNENVKKNVCHTRKGKILNYFIRKNWLRWF